MTPAQSLGAVIDEFSEPFTGPIRMAELHDGRVLAMDARESRLVVLDFVSGTQHPAATRGDGPLEYRTGFRFAAAPADSVWMFDLMRGRIVVFSPSGSPVRGFDITNADARARLSVPWLLRTMPDGAWYGTSHGHSFEAPRSAFADSIAVVRVSAYGDASDTVAMLLAEGTRRTTAGGARRLTAFDPHDLTAVFSDGRVLVVRGERYTAGIVMPDGTARTPAPIAHQRVALTAADITTVRDSVHRLTAGLIAMSMTNLPLAPGSAPRVAELMPPDPAPAIWPVLMGESIPVDTRDRAWVAVRDSSLGTLGQRYDLIDREGMLVGAVRVPPSYELVGFGAAHLFIARRDGDDLLWLQRYALP